MKESAGGKHKSLNAFTYCSVWCRQALVKARVMTHMINLVISFIFCISLISWRKFSSSRYNLSSSIHAHNLEMKEGIKQRVRGGKAIFLL